MRNGNNGFDTLASIYDFLAWVIFDKSIKNAQRQYLSELANAKEILILGGGTGWILNDVFSVTPDAKVTYIELSKKMIRQSRKSVKPNFLAQVSFVNSTYENHASDVKYDAIITPFFLDMFTTETVIIMVKELALSLKEDGTWLFTDFQKTRSLYQRCLLAFMYRFFRAICSIEAKQIPDFDVAFEQTGLKKKSTSLFYNTMIIASLYLKKDP